MTRRDWLGAAAVVFTAVPGAEWLEASEETTQLAPYLALQKFIAPGFDEFPQEKIAMEVRAALRLAMETGELPVAAGCTGFSPHPVRYEARAADLHVAVYNPADRDISAGWKAWRQSLGTIRRFEVYPLPDGVVRYEVASASAYRVGRWKMRWLDGKLVEFKPVSEEVASAREPFFRDVTATVFASTTSFQEQLLRGVPYWRARLDPATGIDIYGSNGIAVGDIDGDGVDEVYVCQPGGLPNRLYKFGPQGELSDITESWKVGLLDDTSAALFLDLRNTGRQDLVVLRSGGPVLLLNEGTNFALKPDAFRFAQQPKGGFTGMAAADFDRDGRLDLYLCCYVYFQSEAQYTYAAPYHDAQNGPPNFLFRNRLKSDGTGSFEDCTAETGMNENNNRFSFAPAWCDFNDDGWPDLYVANDFGRKNFYVNSGGKFRDRAKELGVEDIGPGMSASWFDYDGDGRADLYVANMWSDAGQRVAQEAKLVPVDAYRRHTRGNSLYRNRGDGRFDDTTVEEEAGFGRWAWASGGHDFDNDGQAEIFVTCGMLTNTSQADLMSFFWRQVVAKSPGDARPSQAYQNGWNAINQFVREDYSWSGHEPNVLHVRRGNRYFDFSGVSGLDVAEDGRAFAVTDFDGDGRPDLLLKSRLGPQVRVFQNNCAGRHQAIALQLEGTASNRDAIGARVRMDGQTKWLDAGSGFLSQHSKRMIFGLGEARAVKKVEITWPSGTSQTFTNWQAGRTYFVKEGSAECRHEGFRPRHELASRPATGENGLSLQDTWLAEPLPLPEKHKGPGLLVLLDGQKSPSLASMDAKVIDFAKELAVRREQYAIFRRYLFDWRTDLRTPLAFLLNEDGQAVKVYGGVPAAAQLQADLARSSEQARLALPFPGEYVARPTRDFFKFGAAFLWAGFPVQALPYLEEVVRRTPTNARVLVLVGQIRLDQQQFAGAEESFRSALAVDGGSAEALYGLGLCLAKQEHTDEARERFKQAIAARPDYGDAVNDLGALYMQQGKVEDAIAAFQYGVRVAPDQDILYLNLGRAYTGLGRMEQARQVMQQLLDRKPNDAVALHALQELNGR